MIRTGGRYFLSALFVLALGVHAGAQTCGSGYTADTQAQQTSQTGENLIYGNVRFAQAFKPGFAYEASPFSVYIDVRLGADPSSFGSDLTVEIRADNAGKPATGPINANLKITITPYAFAINFPSWVEAYFNNNNTSLQKDTTYWVVCYQDGFGGDIAHAYRWGYATGDPYTRGWDARSTDNNNWTTYSGEDIAFKVCAKPAPAPPAPTLVSPANGATIAVKTPTLDWNDVGGADYYQCTVYDASDAIVDQQVPLYVSQSTVPSGKLLNGSTYHWIAWAHNSVGWGPQSAIWYFTVSIAAPVKASPVNGAYTNTPTPSLLASSVAGATNYGWWIWDGATVVVDPWTNGGFTGSNGFAVPAGLLTAGKTYTWDCRAYADSNWGQSSGSTWSFTPVAPSAPTWGIPGGDETEIPTEPTLSWDAVTGAGVDWYQLDIFVDTTLVRQYLLPAVANPMKTISIADALAPRTRYNWRIFAHNAVGWGPSSAYWYFTTCNAEAGYQVITVNGNSFSSHQVFLDQSLLAARRTEADTTSNTYPSQALRRIYGPSDIFNGSSIVRPADGRVLYPALGNPALVSLEAGARKFTIITQAAYSITAIRLTPSAGGSPYDLPWLSWFGAACPAGGQACVEVTLPPEAAVSQGLHDLTLTLSGNTVFIPHAVRLYDSFRSPYKIVLLSDVHIGEPVFPEASNKSDYRVAHLDALFDHLKTYEKPDVVVFTGDIVNGCTAGSQSCYGDQYRALQWTLLQSDLPVFVTPGNHDQGWPGNPNPLSCSRHTDEFRLWLNPAFDSGGEDSGYLDDYAFDFGSDHHVVVDSGFGGDVLCGLTTGQLNWLKADAARAGWGRTFFFSHAPVVTDSTGLTTAYMSHWSPNDYDFVNWMMGTDTPNANFAGFFAGHTHVAEAYTVTGLASTTPDDDNINYSPTARFSTFWASDHAVITSHASAFDNSTQNPHPGIEITSPAPDASVTNPMSVFGNSCKVNRWDCALNVALSGDGGMTWGSSFATNSDGTWSGDVNLSPGQSVILARTYTPCVFNTLTNVAGVRITPVCQNPGMPNAPAYSAITSTSVVLTWTDVANETGYGVYKSVNGGGSYSRIATVGAGTTTYPDSGLTPYTTYWYRIVADAGGSCASQMGIGSSVTTACVNPGIPGIPTLSGTTSTSMTVQWTDVDYEATYGVFRSDNGGGSYSRIATLPADTISYPDSGLTPYSTYWYRIAADACGSCTSQMGNGNSGSTLCANPGVPGVPSFSAVTTTSAIVQWTDVNYEATYGVFRSDNGGGSYSRIATVAADTVSYPDSGLTPGFTYWYRIAADAQGTCAGQLGSGVSVTTVALARAVPDGRLTGAPMTAASQSPSGDTISVAWDTATCPSPTYNIYYGDLADVGTLTFAGSACDIGSSPGVWSGVPSGYNVFWIIVGDNGAGIEGSWGEAYTGGAWSQRSGSVSGFCGNTAISTGSTCP